MIRTPNASVPQSDCASPTRTTSPVNQEALHDARQTVATILALLAAGSRTVGDPRQTLTRLQQIESELLTLWSMFQRAEVENVDAVVDAGIEASELAGVLVLEYPGRIRVVADTEAWVSMSRTDLRRILGNLLRNAMRAAGAEGTVLVTVTAGADEVTILVEDDGPGLGALPVIHGVGLRSVARLVDDAGGSTDARAHGRLGGASVKVSVPTAGTGSAA